jgi:hypothetical protein
MKNQEDIIERLNYTMFGDELTTIQLNLFRDIMLKNDWWFERNYMGTYISELDACFYIKCGKSRVRYSRPDPNRKGWATYYIQFNGQEYPGRDQHWNIYDPKYTTYKRQLEALYNNTVGRRNKLNQLKKLSETL